MEQSVPFPLDEEALVEWTKKPRAATANVEPLGSIFIILVGNDEIERAIKLCKRFEGFKRASSFGILLVSILMEFEYTDEARSLAQWTTDQMHPSLKDCLHPYESFLTIAEHTKDPNDIRLAQLKVSTMPNDEDRKQGLDRLDQIIVERAMTEHSPANN